MTTPTPKIPWHLNGEPRPVQVEALRRSYGKKGWGHFLEMRLGKTATLLNEFMVCREDYGLQNLLVLSPNTFKEDWGIAADKWGLGVPWHVFDAGKIKAFDKFRRQNSTGAAVFFNYEALGSLKSAEAARSMCGDFTMIGADESIKLKNPDSSTQKAALGLAKQCRFRRILSGKPMTQGPYDLYGQLRFIGECDGWKSTAFKAAFCETGGFQGKQIIGAKNEDRLHGILDRCSFTARKIDWIDGFQKPDYSERFISLSGDQGRLYGQMQAEFVAELEDGKTVTAEQIITKLLKMQQIASGFIIDDDGDVHEVVPLDKNPRIQAIRAMLEEEIPGKLIVFAHYRHSLDMLLRALEPWSPAAIRGGAKDLVEQKRRFNEDEECRVIACQLDASKYGHQLIGSEKSPALTSCFFESTYSNDTRSQCEERNQRGDKALALTVIDFFSTQLDRNMVRALQMKEDLAALILRYDRATGILPR